MLRWHTLLVNRFQSPRALTFRSSFQELVMLLCTALLYIPCCSGDVHSSCFQLLITTKSNDYFHPHLLTTPRGKWSGVRREGRSHDTGTLAFSQQCFLHQLRQRGKTNNLVHEIRCISILPLLELSASKMLSGVSRTCMWKCSLHYKLC